MKGKVTNQAGIYLRVEVEVPGRNNQAFYIAPANAIDAKVGDYVEVHHDGIAVIVKVYSSNVQEHHEVLQS